MSFKSQIQWLFTLETCFAKIMYNYELFSVMCTKCHFAFNNTDWGWVPFQAMFQGYDLGMFYRLILEMCILKTSNFSASWFIKIELLLKMLNVEKCHVISFFMHLPFCHYPPPTSSPVSNKTKSNPWLICLLWKEMAFPEEQWEKFCTLRALLLSFCALFQL